MKKDKKFNGEDDCMGGMVSFPGKKTSQSGNSAGPASGSRPVRPVKVKPFHNKELFNKVLTETEKKQERASLLIDPDIVGRVILAILFLAVYLIFFR